MRGQVIGDRVSPNPLTRTFLLFLYVVFYACYPFSFDTVTIGYRKLTYDYDHLYLLSFSILYLPYSSYHYFLNYKEIPECLKHAWIAQHYQEDKEAIEAFLTQPVDTTQLQELKKAPSLVEAPNSDHKPDMQKLQKMLEDITDIKERNKQILKAIEQGYSQHMIAKVLGISQQAVGGVVKRSRK